MARERFPAQPSLPVAERAGDEILSLPLSPAHSDDDIAELYLAGILAPDGTIDGSFADRTPRVVADGRTFAYVLWDGERSTVHLTVTGPGGTPGHACGHP